MNGVFLGKQKTLFNKSEVKFESNDRIFSKKGIVTVGDNSISDRQHLKQMFPE